MRDGVDVMGSLPARCWRADWQYVAMEPDPSPTVSASPGSGWRQILRGSRGVPTTRWTAPDMWKPTPASFASLILGLWLFGTGEAFLFAANLGATPWGVLAQGVSRHVGIDIGWATFVVGLVVLLAWIPLKQRPGLGTISNIIVISIAVDVVFSHLATPPTLVLRFLLMLAGIATIGLGSGFYLTAGHGPGPRDGWMTGLHRVTGRPVGQIRLVIEVCVLIVGWLLGGTVGIGTALFALLIGHSVALGLSIVRAIAPHSSST